MTVLTFRQTEKNRIIGIRNETVCKPPSNIDHKVGSSSSLMQQLATPPGVQSARRKTPILGAPPATVTYTRPNILYARLDASGRGRIQISAELPLIYATGRRGEPPPQVRFPAADDYSKPGRARESKLEPESFLKSLPVYRYRQ
jgi:hypothetical protein